MPRRLLAALTVFMLVPAASAAGQARLGEAISLPLQVGSIANLAADSSVEHGIALAYVDVGALGSGRPVVAHQTAGGRWRSFELPVARPEGIRLALLENGGGLVAWDDASAGTVSVRMWQRDGTLGPVRTVLSGVRTVWTGDTVRPGWSMSSDRAGTVVIAAPGAGDRREAVDVTIRDPGGAFGAQQQVAPPTADPASQRRPGVGPIAPDGTVRVTWDTADRPTGPGFGQPSAVRRGREATFGPTEPQPADDPSVHYSAGSIPVRPGSQMQRLCGDGRCRDLRAFDWGAGADAVAFARLGRTYVARRQADGTFDPPVPVRGSVAVQLPRRGDLGFVREGPGTGVLNRVAIVPFGTAPDRRRPRAALAPFAQRTGVAGAVELRALCDEPCRLRASVQVVRGRRAGVRRSAGAVELPDPLTSRRVLVRGLPATPSGSSLRVTLAVRDRTGKRSTSVFRMVRGRGTSLRRTFCVAQLAPRLEACR